MSRKHADNVDLTLRQHICISLFLVLKVNCISPPLLLGLLLNMSLQVLDIAFALIRHWSRPVVRCLSGFLVVDENIIPVDPWDMVLLVLRRLTHRVPVRLIVVDYVPNQILKWLKPHPQDVAQLGKPLDVRGEIVLALVADVADHCLREVVAVLLEWIIVSPVPELSKVVNDLAYLIR